MASRWEEGIVTTISRPGMGDAAFDTVACVMTDGGGGIRAETSDLAPYAVVGEFMSRAIGSEEA